MIMIYDHDFRIVFSDSTEVIFMLNNQREDQFACPTELVYLSDTSSKTKCKPLMHIDDKEYYNVSNSDNIIVASTFP